MWFVQLCGVSQSGLQWNVDVDAVWFEVVKECDEMQKW